MSENEALRAKVEAFYKKHAPEDLGKVDGVLKLKVSEDGLFKKLHKKYNLNGNGEPAGDAKEKKEKKEESKSEAGDDPDDKAALRAKVEAFYKKHAPEDLGKVDGALKLKVSEDELFKKLYKKYNLNENGETAGEAKEKKDESAAPTPASPKKGPPSPGMLGKKGPPPAMAKKRPASSGGASPTTDATPGEAGPSPQGSPTERPPSVSEAPLTPLATRAESVRDASASVSPTASTRAAPAQRADTPGEAPPPVDHHTNSGLQGRIFGAPSAEQASKADAVAPAASRPQIPEMVSKSDVILADSKMDGTDVSPVVHGVVYRRSPAEGGGPDGSLFRCRVTIGHHFPAAKNHYLHGMNAAQQRELMRCLGADLKACLQRLAGVGSPSPGKFPQQHALVAELLSSDITEGNGGLSYGSEGPLGGGLTFYWVLTYATPQAARTCYAAFKSAALSADLFNLNGDGRVGHPPTSSSPLFNSQIARSASPGGGGSFRLRSPPSANSAYAGTGSNQSPPPGAALVQIPQARLAYSDAQGRPSDVPCAVLSDFSAVYADGTVEPSGQHPYGNMGADEWRSDLMLSSREDELSRLNDLLNARAASPRVGLHHSDTFSESQRQVTPIRQYVGRDHLVGVAPSPTLALFAPGKGAMFNPASSESLPGVPMRDLVDLKERERALRDQEGFLQDAQANLTRQSRRIQAMMDEQLRRMELVEKREQQLHTREREIEEEKSNVDNGLRKQLRETEARLTDLASENEILKLRLHNMALHRAHNPQGADDQSAVRSPYGGHQRLSADIKERLLQEREEQLTERERQVRDRESRTVAGRVESTTQSRSLLSELSPYRSPPSSSHPPLNHDFPGHQAGSRAPLSRRDEEVRAMMERMQARDQLLSRHH